MVRRYYDLPSLTTLAIFEASARHLSFKLAAANTVTLSAEAIGDAIATHTEKAKHDSRHCVGSIRVSGGQLSVIYRRIFPAHK